MATVTGYTAERMKQIEDSAIIDGRVDGDDLFLTPYGFAADPVGYPEINAGDVRGPIGSPGVTSEQLDDFILNTSPVGSITDYIGTVPPEKWLSLAGQTVVNGQTLYPDFWAIIPASMKSGADILMPDARGRVTVGLNPADTLFDAIGETGGSKNATLPTHVHTGPSHTHTTPDHTHSIAHNHASFNVSGGSHAHEYWDPTNGVPEQSTGPGSVGYAVRQPQLSQTSTNSSHTHVVDVPAYVGNTDTSGDGTTGAGGTGNTGSAGVSATNANLPPFITFLKIVKVE